MRGFIRLLIATLFVLPFFVAPHEARAQTVEVSFGYFHDQLAPYGEWRNSPRWGDVWVPNAGRDFRPYSSAGHWENTDEYGTVWASDYEWGEIPFHYGRWVWDPDLAWIWVPGYVWGPGWVLWRQGGDNVGWFPMPPGDYYGDGIYGDDWSDYYGYRGWYGPGFDEAMFFSFWVFVPNRYLFVPHWHGYFIDYHGYHGFWGHTRNWTHYTIVNNIVVNVSINIHEHPRMFGDVRTVSGRSLFRRPITTVNRGRSIMTREMRHVGAAQRANFRSNFHNAFNRGRAGQDLRRRLGGAGVTGPGRGAGQGTGLTGAGRGKGGAVTGPGRGAGQGTGLTGAGRGKGGAVTGAGRGAGQGTGLTGAGRGKGGAVTGAGRGAGQGTGVTGAGRGKGGAVTGAGRGAGQGPGVTGAGRGKGGAVTGAGRGAGQGTGVTGAGRGKGGAVTGAGRGAGPGATGAGRGKGGAVTGAGRGQGQQVTGKARGQGGTGVTQQRRGQQGQGAGQTQGQGGKKKKCVGPNCPP